MSRQTQCTLAAAAHSRCCFVLALLLTSIHTGHTSVEPSSEKVNSLCTESKYTRHLAKHIETDGALPEASLHKLRSYASGWLVLAVAETDIKRAAATYALEIKATENAKNAEQAAQAKQRAARQATTVLLARSSIATALLATTVKEKTGSTTTAAGAGAPTADKSCTLSFKPTTAYPETCKDDISAGDGPEKVPIQLSGKTQIKLLSTQHLAARKITVTAQTKGTQNTINAQTGHECRNNGGATSDFIRMETAATADETPVTPADVSIEKLNNAPSGCGTLKDRNKKTAFDNELLAQAICEYIQTPKAQPADPTQHTPGTLSTDNEIQNQYTAYLAAAGVKVTDKKTVESELKSLYGPEPGNFNDKFVKNWKIWK
uniref:Variant surface glycoprotein 1526 n=1 Tax=Trypanosoma brucei TaxID=5691 RepID=M4T0D1_9TRYP|nr:variant surface glycoprotein 1526 [Trypanosoma brucei]